MRNLNAKIRMVEAKYHLRKKYYINGIHPNVQAYIDRIVANDQNLTEIQLDQLSVSSADIEPLMLALDSNENVAGQIISVSLYLNELTTFPNLTRLVALRALDLSFSTLTVASAIALNAEKLMRNIRIAYDCCDRELAIDALLTLKNLDEHFKLILQTNFDETFDYLKKLFKNLGAKPLLRLPIEHLRVITNMLPIPGISLRASMANLKEVFTRLAHAPNGDATNLNILNSYDARFQALANVSENLHENVFNSIKEVIRARRALEIAGTAAVNQPVTKAAVLNLRLQ
jgi:hypothetical protein